MKRRYRQTAQQMPSAKESTINQKMMTDDTTLFQPLTIDVADA